MTLAELSCLLIDLAVYAIIGVFLYAIIYQRIIRMYYYYWYYTSQGIPCVGFPLPIIGNLHIFQRVFGCLSEHSKTPLEEYFDEVFKGQILVQQDQNEKNKP